MGQRPAIMMMILSGGLVAPPILAGLLASALGPAAVPVGAVALCIGLAGILASLWPARRRAEVISGAAGEPSRAGGALLWSSCAVIATALLLILFAFALR